MAISKVFSTKIKYAENGMDAAFISIPFEVKNVFGSMRPKVVAVFDKKVRYQGSLVRMGSPDHMLLMRKDVRAELGKSVGDTVHVRIELDTNPRIVEIPEKLQKLLTRNKKAGTFFSKLSYSHQKEYVQYVIEAKKEETKERRIKKVLEMLKEEVKTPK